MSVPTEFTAFIGVVAGVDDGCGHMWGGGWMWLWGSLMVTLWIAAIATAIWFVVRRTGSDRPASRAREILSERFARGEISTEEYHEREAQLP